MGPLVTGGTGTLGSVLTTVARPAGTGTWAEYLSRAGSAPPLGGPAHPEAESHP